jgi:hypothetical protein
VSEPSPGPWRFEDGWVVDVNGDVVSRHIERNGPLMAAAPEMLALLRGAADWYCGELPDGTDRRAAIRDLLARLDIADPERDCPPCPRCKLELGTPIKESGVERFEGPPSSTLFCPSCGAGWVGSEADVARARAAWAAYEATLR